jgi:hypothetical protein
MMHGAEIARDLSSFDFVFGGTRTVHGTRSCSIVALKCTMSTVQSLLQFQFQFGFPQNNNKHNIIFIETTVPSINCYILVPSFTP